MRNKILVSLLVLFCSVLSYASIRTNTPDATITGYTTWRTGGAYSDGKHFIYGDNGILGIYSNIPTADGFVGNAPVKITGFVQIVQGYDPSCCIVADKIFACDSDPAPGGDGYHIKVWNTIPETNTIATSCDYKITGLPNQGYITTDGTRLGLVVYPTVYVWNSIPTGTTTLSSANSWAGLGYDFNPAWLGASGKLYTVDCHGAGVFWVSIFNTIPPGAFSIGTPDVKIVYSYDGAYYINMSVVEMRNILYFFAINFNDGKSYAYIWKDIPTANTDTSTISDSFQLNVAYGYEAVTADLHNFYRWNGSQGGSVQIIRNDYDTFTVTGTDIAPQSIDRRHLYREYYKVIIYTYPGKAMLNSVKLQLTGTGADSDVSSVKIIDDVNKDGVYTAGTDAILGTGTFANKVLIIDNINLYIDAGEKHLLVTYDISENAVLNNTVGVKIEYFIFEKRYYEYPTNMTSTNSTITTSIIPQWNGDLKIDYTERNRTDDGQYAIALSWDTASGGAPPLIYRLYHYIDGAMNETFSETMTSKVITSLGASKKHSFKAKVIDSFGNETSESLLVYDETAPEWTGTFKVEDASTLNAEKQWQYKIKISWDASTDNTSRDILYEVWVKEEGKDWIAKQSSWEKTVEVSGLTGVVYMKMRARDSAWNYTGYGSEKKLRLTPFLGAGEEVAIGNTGGKITLEELDGDKVELEIPEGALSGNFTIAVERAVEAEYTYKFSVYDDKNIARKIIFAKPVTVKFYYNDAKIIRMGYEEKNLRIMHYDDMKWINVGGEVNSAENTVKTKIYSFSKYKLIGEKDADKPVVNVYPALATPNGDEINDAVFFVVGWNYSGNAVIRIYDIDGKEVWEYSGTDRTTVWRCRDAGGRLAEAGGYVYNVRVENRTFSGIITVAR